MELEFEFELEMESGIVGVSGQLSNAFSADYLRAGQLDGNVEQQFAHSGQFLRLPVRLWLGNICNKRTFQLQQFYLFNLNQEKWFPVKEMLPTLVKLSLIHRPQL